MQQVMNFFVRHQTWAIRLAAALVLSSLPLSAHAALLYDQNLTSDILYGSGNVNEKFTVNRANGVELGLRGKVRFPAPLAVYNSSGNGTYSFPTNAVGAFGGPGGNNPSWHFEWSINTNYDGSSGLNLNDLTYQLRLDTDRYNTTNFYTFDPINLATADHGIGTNATANGAGDNDMPPARTAIQYANLIDTNNVAQNSWRTTFFPIPFNPSVGGLYTFQLEAFQGSTSLGLTSIDVFVGAGPPAPEPGTCLMLLTGVCGIMAVRRRKLAAC
jgi:hypothetical protein